MSLPQPRRDTDPHTLPDTPVPGPEVVGELRARVAERLRYRPDTSADRTAVVSDEVARWAATRALTGPAVDTATRQRLAGAVLATVSGMGGLAPLVDRDDVEIAHIQGHDRVVVELADGSLQPSPPVADSDDDLLELVANLFARYAPADTDFSLTNPLGSLRLPAGGPLGSRLAAVRAVTPRPCVTIRRHRLPQATLGDLRELGTLDAIVQEWLTCAVLAGLTILVTGARHTGKTTLLRALCHEIPRDHHVVTVETDLELGLHLDRTRLVTALEARNTSLDDVSVESVVTQATRHCPSRIVLGDLAGGELGVLLREWAQCPAGDMATLNASSPRAVPDRLADLGHLAIPPLPVAATHRWMTSAVDLIVHVSRTDDPRSAQRHRVVTEIAEVDDTGEVTTLFETHGTDGRAVLVREPSTALRNQLTRHGLAPECLALSETTGAQRGEHR